MEGDFNSSSREVRDQKISDIVDQIKMRQEQLGFFFSLEKESQPHNDQSSFDRDYMSYSQQLRKRIRSQGEGIGTTAGDVGTTYLGVGGTKSMHVGVGDLNNTRSGDEPCSGDAHTSISGDSENEGGEGAIATSFVGVD